MAKEATSSLGVDFGTSHIGAVRLRLVDGHPEIASAASFCLEQDGLLDESELHQAFSVWLKDKHLEHQAAVCGLPAHLANSAISFFPAAQSDEDVAKIISFQTKQLCGLADEPFCSTSQFLADKADGSRSVLLSVCKAQVAENYCRIMAKLGLETLALADNAQALINAFAFLKPDGAGNHQLQMLLDIGSEDSSFVLMQDNVIVNIGTLPFGGSQFTARLAGYLNCDEKTASMRKHDSADDWRDENSASNRVIRDYAEELRHYVNLPQGGNGKALAENALGAIWITGGGALFPNLERELNRCLGLPVTIFGVPAAMLMKVSDTLQCPQGVDCHPQLTTALGLALQGLPGAMLNLSLLPERLRWQQQKMREFPYLFGAAVLIVFTLAIASCVWLLGLRQDIIDLEQRKANLEDCLKLAPQLERAYRSIIYHQEKLLPIVEYGRRFNRFRDALCSCNDVLDNADGKQQVFGFYLADEFTFAEGFPSAKRAKAEAVPAKLEGAPSVFTVPAASPEMKDDAVLVSDFPMLKSMFLGGMGEAGDASYQVVKDIQTRFHERSAFSNVDDYIDSVRLDGKEQIFQQWTSFFEKQSDKLEQSCALFLLKMPFGTTLTVNGQELPRIGRTAPTMEKKPEPQNAASDHENADDEADAGEILEQK